MTIQEYFEKEKEVYVRNRTNPLGVVSIPLATDRGETTFLIPKTVLPVCLTQYVPKEQIVKSTGFRGLVQRGAIELLTEEQYNQVITPEDELALSRIIEGPREHSADFGSVATEAGTSMINPRVMQIVNLSSVPESDLGGVKPEIAAMIQELEGLDLTQDDLAYILASAKGELAEWARIQLKNVNRSSVSEEKVSSGGRRRGRQQVSSEE